MKRLDADLRRLFETGRDILGHFSPRLSDEELREKLREPWRRHGARVTRDFVRRHPGQRPACWWWFDAPPEPRPRAPEPNPDSATKTWEERDFLQAFLDRCFLTKHGLLTVAERRILEAQDDEWMRLAEEHGLVPPGRRQELKDLERQQSRKED
jgi:hypothetical protein